VVENGFVFAGFFEDWWKIMYEEEDEVMQCVYFHLIDVLTNTVKYFQPAPLVSMCHVNKNWPHKLKNQHEDFLIFFKKLQGYKSKKWTKIKISPICRYQNHIFKSQKQRQSKITKETKIFHTFSNRC
jgi:hypothetical protein